MLLLWMGCAVTTECAVTYVDLDHDGYGGEAAKDCDGVALGGDCDDEDSAVNPAAAEGCDGVDQDCDGTVDEGLDVVVTWPDADRDGYGDTATPHVGCAAPIGDVTLPGDCDDTDAARSPVASEVCNAVDDDCDGEVDDDATDAAPAWRDVDGDGWGGEDLGRVCDRVGVIDRAGDCDDADAAVSPDGIEICDGVDQDCDGEVDERATDAPTWHPDVDGDGYGDPDLEARACAAPAGLIADASDCDDGDAAVNPDGVEVAGDRIDQDCDGTFACYGDLDGDGETGSAVVLSTTSTCAGPGQSATPGPDCDDGDATVSTDADEVPYDGIDQDCDGVDTDDLDGDGEVATAAGGSDCDDENPEINTAALERCDPDGVDEDCDGGADNLDPDLATTAWYTDGDGDGAGDPATLVLAACRPDETVPLGGDCDDADPTRYPRADEACDGLVDLNCDGAVGAVDGDGDGALACDDCDDTDATVAPGAAELAHDARDNDCDGLADEVVGDQDLATTTELAALCAEGLSVEGDLTVHDVDSLLALSCLHAVSGSLRLDNLGATDLTGLDSLTSVGRDLMIGGEDELGALDGSELTGITGLERLRTVGRDLTIADADVRDLSPLARMDRVGGDLSLLRLYDIPEVAPPMASVGGDLVLDHLSDMERLELSAVTLDGGLTLTSSGTLGFLVTGFTTLPGTLSLIDLSDEVDRGWEVPEAVGGLTMTGTETVPASLVGIRAVEGDVTLEDVADFGGLDGIETIGGALQITDASGSAWDGFDSLLSLGGDLTFTGGTPNHLSGFSALTELGGALVITDASKLLYVSAFSALPTMKALTVRDAAVLTDLSGFSHVVITEDVHLSGLPRLTNLRAFEAVVALSGGLSAEDMDGLLSLEGLEQLTTVGDGLTLDNCPALGSLDGLAGLTEVEGNMAMTDLDAVYAASLPSLVRVGQDLSFNSFNRLDSIDLPALEEVRSLGVYDAPVKTVATPSLRVVGGSLQAKWVDLDTWDAPALTRIEEDLLLETVADAAFEWPLLATVGNDLTLRNTTMTALPDFPGLTTIGRDLWLDGNVYLASLDGLPDCFTLGHTFYLYFGAVTDLTPLACLDHLDGNLIVVEADALTDLSGLDGLTDIAGSVRISSNAQLVDLTGLDALTTIGGDLEVGELSTWTYTYGNPRLTTLDGLGALTSVGGALNVSRNDTLADIDALSALTTVEGNFSVTYNVALPAADAEALRDRVDIGGTSSVAGNLE